MKKRFTIKKDPGGDAGEYFHGEEFFYSALRAALEEWAVLACRPQRRWDDKKEALAKGPEIPYPPHQDPMLEDPVSLYAWASEVLDLAEEEEGDCRPRAGVTLVGKTSYSPTLGSRDSLSTRLWWEGTWTKGRRVELIIGQGYLAVELDTGTGERSSFLDWWHKIEEVVTRPLRVGSLPLQEGDEIDNTGFFRRYIREVPARR